MSNPAKILTIAGLAFLFPVVVAIGMNWDTIQSQFEVTAETARGRVLCFTAPG